MGSFIVFQGKAFKEQYQGGYLWAPRYAKDGSERFYWNNMKKLKLGDTILSICNGEIVAYIKVTKGCQEAEMPKSLRHRGEWDQDRNGWLVYGEYHLLKPAISLIPHKANIAKYCPDKYAPFTKKGDGNQGYLYEIYGDLLNYFKKII